MANEPERHTALGDVAARQLANATKTTPQMKRITPRWADPPATVGPRGSRHLPAESRRRRVEGHR